MTEPRKIVILTSEFPPGPGGIGNHAWNLAKELVTAGLQVTVVTDSRREWKDAEQGFDAIQPFRLFRARRDAGRMMGVLHRWWLYLLAWLRAEPNEWILLSGKFSLWFGGVATLLPVRRRIAAVLHGSEINPRSGWKKWLTRLGLSACDRLIAVSSYTRDLALRLDPGLDINIIPNGFDPEKITHPGNGKMKGVPALVTVGTLSPRKGQENVIQALPNIRRRFPRVHYHLVGLPQQASMLQVKAQSLGLDDSLTIHGALPDKDLARVLKGSDIFVMLSTEQADGDVEGFGIAILEANAAGLPAVGSANCGIADAICDGFSGRLVDPQNPEQVAEAVEDILNDYERYSMQAKEWAARFHWSVGIEKYLEVLDL